jgi:DNA repair protein RAD50
VLQITDLVSNVCRELANQKLDRKRQKLTEHTERVQQLKSSLNELRSEKLQIETDLQRRTRLEESKDKLTAANESLNREMQVCLKLN